MVIPKSFIANKKSSVEDLILPKFNGKIIELNNSERIRYFSGDYDYIIDWEKGSWKLYEKDGVKWHPSSMDETALDRIKKELTPVSDKLGLFLDESELEHTSVRSLIEKIALKVEKKTYPDKGMINIKEEYITKDGTMIILNSTEFTN